MKTLKFDKKAAYGTQLSRQKIMTIRTRPFSKIYVCDIGTDLHFFVSDNPNFATPQSHSSLLRNIINDPLSPLPAMSPATQEIYDVLISDPKLQMDNSPNIVENSEVEDSDDSVLDPDFDVKNLRNVRTISETDCESSDDAIDSKSTSTQPYRNLDENKIDCVISKNLKHKMYLRCIKNKTKEIHNMRVQFLL